jgi:hypothetical protein
LFTGTKYGISCSLLVEANLKLTKLALDIVSAEDTDEDIVPANVLKPPPLTPLI